MTTLSLCMIVKNEERVLARCLESVKDAVDEIVIVDTGSSDDTVQIARRYAARVFFFPWQNDFSAARNFSFSKAEKTYILWLDADDVVPKSELEKLFRLKQRLETTPSDTVVCRYELPFNTHLPPLSFRRERIFRREARPVWQGAVHECIPAIGAVLYSDFTVRHEKIGSHGTRNLDIYRALLASGKAFNARDLFYYGRELAEHGFYLEAIETLTKFTARKDGWFVNKIDALKTIALCRAEQGDYKEALNALFSTFSFGAPRAGVVCEIAHIYTRQRKYDEAKQWYSFALQCDSREKDGDFENPADRSFTPLLGLVYCSYHLKNTALARFYHEKMKALYPDHPSVVYNENFFKR